jgi:mRNA interferase MazF
MSPTNPPAMADEAPQRGEVWIMRFGSSFGGEMQKVRPAVVLSNDTANALLNRVQVVPISSQVSRLYPAEAYVTLNGERRKAMADQITTISKQRLHRRLGQLSMAGYGGGRESRGRATGSLVGCGRGLRIATEKAPRLIPQAVSGFTSMILL